MSQNENLNSAGGRYRQLHDVHWVFAKVATQNIPDSPCNLHKPRKLANSKAGDGIVMLWSELGSTVIAPAAPEDENINLHWSEIGLTVIKPAMYEAGIMSALDGPTFVQGRRYRHLFKTHWVESADYRLAIITHAPHDFETKKCVCAEQEPVHPEDGRRREGYKPCCDQQSPKKLGLRYIHLRDEHWMRIRQLGAAVPEPASPQRCDHHPESLPSNERPIG